MGRDATPTGGVGLSLVRARLVSAYRAARYEVSLYGRALRIRVAAPTPALLSAFLGASAGGVFVTACAPFGRRRAAGAERRAQRSLVRLLLRSRRRHLEGEGGDDCGVWPAEPSVLVPVANVRAAARWGQALRQNAVLWVPRRGRVRILLLR